MGFWNDVQDFAEDAGDWIESGANAVGDAVGSAVESAGDAIADGLDWVGDQIGGDIFFDWLGQIIKGGFTLAGVTIKAGFNLFGTSLGGAIKLIGGFFSGIFTGDWDVFHDGWKEIVGSIFGSFILIGGKTLAWIQSIAPGFNTERPLSKEEKSKLRHVFKDSLNYYVIRIVEKRSGIFSIPQWFGEDPRPFVLGNTIYLNGLKLSDSDLGDPELQLSSAEFVHEGLHVWQYQNIGVRYSAEALGAQAFVPDEYEWEREIETRGKNNWEDFNWEAQGEFFEDVWIEGELRDQAGNTPTEGDGVFFNTDEKLTPFFRTQKYTDIANEAVDIVREA